MQLFFRIVMEKGAELFLQGRFHHVLFFSDKIKSHTWFEYRRYAEKVIVAC